MTDLNELSKLREDYITLAGKIATMNGLSYQSKPKVSTVMKILADYECERLISHLLRNPDCENNKFDRYYSQKHEFYKTKLIDRLKNVLAEMGKSVLIATEKRVDTGRYDVTIISNGNVIKIEDGNGKEVVIEVKGSLNVDLGQIERYLWNNIVLIIVRVVTGHVIKLRTSENAEFLSESLKDLIEKAERILENQPIKIPGYNCYQCSNSECEHANKKRKNNNFKRIAMQDEEFNFDFGQLLKNSYPTINKTVKLAIEELDLVIPTKKALKT